MKTKNIFRMLLVAAALLMGANNVKAEIVNLWTGSATYETVTIDGSEFTRFNSSAKYLYVYVGNANVQFLTTEEEYDDWLWSSDDQNPWIYNANRYYNSTLSRYELPISSDILSRLKSKGFKVQGLGTWSTGLTQIDVYVESGGGSSKTTPILSFGEGAQETYNITFDDSFTGPTATCNIDGLVIIYTSSETSVAEVGTYSGEVNIKTAGTTIITAQTEESTDYNAASISYTLNIAMAYSVNVNAVSNGSVSVDKSSSAAGQTVTITTTPNNGYELESISVKDASNNTVTLNGEGNTRTFTMPASNVTVNATFTPSYSVPEGAERNYLTFETQEYCAATWDSNTNTFTWGNRDGWNTAWTFMAAQNISGDLSNWTHLHLHVSNWTNASAKQLRVVFKEADGNVPSNGDTKEFVVSPNATGNIDLNLVGVNWGNCEIKNIYDLTIYGCARDVESQAASVLVTDAYYVTATVSETYTVSVSAVSHGSVSVNKTSAAKGETVTITTTPDSGYELESISVKDASNNTVTLSGSGNTRTFTMPASNVTVTVTFKEIQTTVNGVLDIVDMGDYIYRTYVTPCVIDFSKSDGVEGYWATSYDEESVTFTQVTNTCDVGVPVLLKKKTGAEVFKLWKLTDEDASGNRPDINYLVAGPATAYGANKYVLTVHSGEVVFAEVNINSATVDRQHAYLDLNGSNARGRLTIKLSGESTGIQSLQSDERSLEGTVYNLRGQRVEHPSKGIYIINGKKVVIK